MGELVLTGAVTRVQIARYAGASGDFNRIHVDEPYAVSIGQPSVMAHGMLVMGLASRAVTSHWPVEAVTSFRGRFLDRVWPGDELVSRSTLVDVHSLSVEVFSSGRVIFGGTAQTGPVDIAGPAAERSYEFLVERGHIRQFAKALQLDDPVHYDPAAAQARGFRDVVAPPTFARSCIAFDPERDIDRPRSLRVAGEHRFDYVKPLCAGDLVTCSVATGRSWTKAGRRGGQLTFREEVVTLSVADQPAVVSTATGIEPERLDF